MTQIFNILSTELDIFEKSLTSMLDLSATMHDTLTSYNRVRECINKLSGRYEKVLEFNSKVSGLVDELSSIIDNELSAYATKDAFNILTSNIDSYLEKFIEKDDLSDNVDEHNRIVPMSISSLTIRIPELRNNEECVIYISSYNKDSEFLSSFDTSNHDVFAMQDSGSYDSITSAYSQERIIFNIDDENADRFYIEYKIDDDKTYDTYVFRNSNIIFPPKEDYVLNFEDNLTLRIEFLETYANQQDIRNFFKKDELSSDYFIDNLNEYLLTSELENFYTTDEFKVLASSHISEIYAETELNTVIDNTLLHGTCIDELIDDEHELTFDFTNGTICELENKYSGEFKISNVMLNNINTHIGGFAFTLIIPLSGELHLSSSIVKIPEIACPSGKSYMILNGISCQNMTYFSLNSIV